MKTRNDYIEWITDFLARINARSLRIETDETLPGIVRIIIFSEDSALLIGRDGEHLRALNHIFERMIEREKDRGEDTESDTENTRFIIDVNDYQKKHIDELVNQTKIYAARAKHFGKPVALPSMSAFDRLIIHAAAQTIEGIETASEGSAGGRYVVVSPRNQTTE